jgi:hypothetical protein
MVKKMMLLAMAAAAVAAFAVPATASASGMFYHEGESFEGAIKETFAGPIGFATGFGGFDCNAYAEVDMETNGGTVTSLEIDTETCTGTGALAACTLVEDEVTKLGTLTPTAADIDIQNVEITNTYGGMCPLTHSTITATAVTATPDNPAAISTLTLSGPVVVDPIGGGEIPAAATGLLAADEPETFGLSES